MWFCWEKTSDFMILKQSFFSRFQIEVRLKNGSLQYTSFSQIHKTRSREILYIALYFIYVKFSYEFYGKHFYLLKEPKTLYMFVVRYSYNHSESRIFENCFSLLLPLRTETSQNLARCERCSCDYPWN